MEQSSPREEEANIHTEESSHKQDTANIREFSAEWHIQDAIKSSKDIEVIDLEDFESGIEADIEEARFRKAVYIEESVLTKALQKSEFVASKISERDVKRYKEDARTMEIQVWRIPTPQNEGRMMNNKPLKRPREAWSAVSGKVGRW